MPTTRDDFFDAFFTREDMLAAQAYQGERGCSWSEAVRAVELRKFGGDEPLPGPAPRPTGDDDFGPAEMKAALAYQQTHRCTYAQAVSHVEADARLRREVARAASGVLPDLMTPPSMRRARGLRLTYDAQSDIPALETV